MILDNVLRYAGWMEHNRYSRKWRDPYLRVRGQWPAIIDDATAERVGAERAARAANRKLADTPHVLSGVCWCMDCDKPMRISTIQSGKTNRHIYLRCTPGQHPFWQMRADAILEFVRAEMGRLATVDIDALLAVDAQPAADTEAALGVARRELERLRRMVSTADDDYYIAGKLDAERHARQISRLQTEIANRQTEIAQLQDRQRAAANQDGRRARLLDVVRNGPAVLESADPTAANIWLRTHMRVWLKDKEVLIVEWL